MYVMLGVRLRVRNKDEYKLISMKNIGMMPFIEAQKKNHDGLRPKLDNIILM